jgi:hypothetical protein
MFGIPYTILYLSMAFRSISFFKFDKSLQLVAELFKAYPQQIQMNISNQFFQTYILLTDKWIYIGFETNGRICDGAC